MKLPIEAIKENWAISEVEWASDKPLRYCGFEISADSGGDGFHVSQRMFEQELMTRWNINYNPCHTLPSRSQSLMKKLSAMSRLTMKNPVKAVEIGYVLLKYLHDPSWQSRGNAFFPGGSWQRLGSSRSTEGATTPEDVGSILRRILRRQC